VRFDYTTVGHVTADVLIDSPGGAGPGPPGRTEGGGSRRPGGSAFYSALQAARLGRRARILTRGVAREIEALTEPYRREFELETLPSRQTTTFETSGFGNARTQRVLAWAGPIDEDVMIDSSILHLAPVARETPARWRGSADFVGLTPQGLVREWAAGSGEISLAAASDQRDGHDERFRAPRPDAILSGLPTACDALVLSENERASCAHLISEALKVDAVVAVTAGPAPTTILLPGGEVLSVEVPAIVDPADDVGAGDVFAAAFFIALHKGKPADVAAGFANAAAAVRIEGAGAGAIGDRRAIEARLRAVGPAS
jgi:hypothetical protein